MKRIWRWVRWPTFVVGFLAAVPLILVPVYGILDPISTPVLMRRLTGQPVIQHWRALDEMSDRLKVIVMMSEDGQFCRHWGVDVSALRAEIDVFFAGQAARGASTISMQVARNLFLWRPPSIARKALEVPLAIYLDLVLSKQRIMEIYLNVAEWGPGGQFGVEAGAQQAFGISGQALSWRHASLLAVTLPNPHLRRPASPNQGLLRVAGIVEARARQYSDRAHCLFEGEVPELD